MRRILGHRPAPGTILGAIALFVAMGGGAYAVSGPPGPNSVGQEEIVTGGAGKTEVGTNAVGRAEIRTDSIAGGKLCEQGDAGCRPITGANFDETTLEGVASATVAGRVTQRYRDQAFNLPAGSGTQRTVLSLEVPAGSYLIHGGTTVTNTEATARTQDCFVRAGADFDQATLGLGAAGSATDVARVNMQLVHTFTAAGTIEMTCEGGSAAGDIAVQNRKIQAHRVAEVSNSAAATP